MLRVCSIVGCICKFNISSNHVTFFFFFYFQAFNLSSNATESVDHMLSESLKDKMPATSLQLFGIKQIEQENMAACEFSTVISDVLQEQYRCSAF